MNNETINAYLIRDEVWKNYLLSLLREFVKETKSKRANYIVENFEQEILKFIHIVPDEVVNKLKHPVVEKNMIA